MCINENLGTGIFGAWIEKFLQYFPGEACVELSLDLVKDPNAWLVIPETEKDGEELKQSTGTGGLIVKAQRKASSVSLNPLNEQVVILYVIFFVVLVVFSFFRNNKNYNIFTIN